MIVPYHDNAANKNSNNLAQTINRAKDPQGCSMLFI